MGAPQVIMIVILAINIFYGLMKSEKSNKGLCEFIGLLVADAIKVLLLWWGGFWG